MIKIQTLLDNVKNKTNIYINNNNAPQNIYNTILKSFKYFIINKKMIGKMELRQLYTYEIMSQIIHFSYILITTKTKF